MLCVGGGGAAAVDVYAEFGKVMLHVAQYESIEASSRAHVGRVRGCSACVCTYVPTRPCLISACRRYPIVPVFCVVLCVCVLVCVCVCVCLGVREQTIFLSVSVFCLSVHPSVRSSVRMSVFAHSHTSAQNTHPRHTNPPSCPSPQKSISVAPSGSQKPGERASVLDSARAIKSSLAPCAATTRVGAAGVTGAKAAALRVKWNGMLWFACVRVCVRVCS